MAWRATQSMLSVRAGSGAGSGASAEMVASSWATAARTSMPTRRLWVATAAVRIPGSAVSESVTVGA